MARREGEQGEERVPRVADARPPVWGGCISISGAGPVHLGKATMPEPYEGGAPRGGAGGTERC